MDEGEDTIEEETPRYSLNLARYAFHSPAKAKQAAPSISPGEVHDTIPSTPNKQSFRRGKRTAKGNRSQGGKSTKRTIQPVQDVNMPDFLRENLDILIIGFNPGFNSASHRRHYAGAGNHFWKCLSASGLVSEPLTYIDDVRILEFNIGLTNIVTRPSLSSSDLTKAELQEGAVELRRKILQYRPKIVAFNGLGIYEAFAGKKDFLLGRQPDTLADTDIHLYVMPSSSPRGAKWPRMEDKLKFYQGLAHLRDFVTGKVAVLDHDIVTFPK